MEDVNTYTYPSENNFTLNRRKDKKFGPFGTQWFHDENQTHDKITKKIKKRTKIFKKLSKLNFHEQGSEGWFKDRDSKITASDLATVLDMNKYEPTYNFIIKKVSGSTFTGNENTYHGKKFEEIATMIYEYRRNVIVREFGLIEHPKYSFLGASPDGIVSKYKKDGIHKTKYVGRMLEIKCPLRRKIKTEGEIIDNICPIYYWVQVQLQLECCDLDECDFWQCNIHEYSDRAEFIEDTDPTEPFRSLETGFEKGCLIQLIKKSKANDTIDNYWETIYNNTQFIYPPSIVMTPLELDVWVLEKLDSINKTHPEYYFDKVIYWRLNNSHNCTIKRDSEWFNKNIKTMEKIWNYVLFFRENKDKYQILLDYIDSLDRKDNSKIMEKIESLVSKIDN